MLNYYFAYSDFNSDGTIQLAMPLVMMCGYPCSGKTTFVEKLQKHLEKLKKNVVIVSDDTVGIDRNSTYHRFDYIFSQGSFNQIFPINSLNVLKVRFL